MPPFILVAFSGASRHVPWLLACVAALAVFPLVGSVLSAQLAVDRAVVGPWRDSTTGRGENFWVEFLHDPSATSTEVAWTYKLAADLPIARLPHHLELRLELGHELTATPANTVGFDPRGAVWAEQLTLTRRVNDRWQWKGGLFIRCRHDIDVGAVQDSTTVRGSQRVVVVSGPQLHVRHRPLVRGGLRVDLAAGAELLTDNGDRRTPANRRSPRWQDARGAWSYKVRLAQRGPAGSAVFAQAWQSAVLFREPSSVWRTNYRLEAGLQLPGGRRGAELVIAAERQFDDMMLPAPRATRVVLLGARLGAHSSR